MLKISIEFRRNIFMEYIGEHLLPGKIGQFGIILAFVSSILATVAYFLATKRKDASWQRIGRWAFLLHGLGIVTAAYCMFYVMTYKMYEYQYAQQHVSAELPFKYIFAAFWEGQEGSFTLWMFWHVVLGCVLMWRSKEWESSVLTTLSLIQVFILSMLLGVYVNLGFGEFKIGSNPLLLLREVMDIPLFQNPNYVQKIVGNGLNPLLQNYWMTIHPPTLFLGFASTSIPFCFAVAALWQGKHREWLRPALSWALFSGAILGTGILMGGAWAYEALSFGGYWAWDPVENMSLVPWIIMIAGIHTNLIARSTGNAIKSTYVFYILSFVLIVYSTFLTRSGILGDTSVHAFTEMGLEWQLVAFLLAFTGLGLGLFFMKSKEIPTIAEEESLSSREFWMFIGTLTLAFSALLITYTTSIPVYNKVSEALGYPLKLSPPVDVVAHYNQYQLWIGVFMGLLSGVAMWLRYKEVNFEGYYKRIGIHLLISLVISLVFTYLGTKWINANAWQYVLLLFAGLFTTISNGDYIISIMRKNLKAVGATVSHFGFGLMIIGTMASGLNKLFISNNAFAQEGLVEGEDKDFYKKNILLLKNTPMTMSGYEVTYVRDTSWDFTRQFLVNYKKRDEKGAVTEEFELIPNILYDKTFTKIAASNPSTKHYWNKDIFTHVSSLPKADMDPEYRKQVEDSLKYISYKGKVGDTIFTKANYAVIEDVTLDPKLKDYKREPNDIAIGLRLSVRQLDSDSTWKAEPILVLRQNELYSYPAQIGQLRMKIKVPDNLFETILVPEEKLKYTNLAIRRGEEVVYNGLKIKLSDFGQTATHPNYTKQEGDIAVNANLEITDTKGKKYTSKPLFVIRESKPFSLKDEVLALGFHTKFVNIDPQTETATIMVAQSENQDLPVLIAENVGRSDYIVLQAIEFPGINYFWAGTILMMFGLGMSMVHRLSKNTKNVVAV
jgi:cytochrome c-type biogenesis protein CcmF